MQYTSNYNLITVEGTDVVNPLVQMNPNFTDIDAAMFANKQAVIGTATEITSGTVHNITRLNPDSNYFRFTATSNWTAGDSMSIDGVNVSVYLTDGTIPATGSYVINSEVFGMISGSRVTLFLAAAPVTSLDADDITFNPTGTGYDPSDTDVDKVLKSIDSTINKGSVHVTADGVKTLGTLLDELYALIDQSKINERSLFSLNTEVSHMATFRPGYYFQFSCPFVRSTFLRVTSHTLAPSGSNARVIEGGTITDNTSTIPNVGDILKITY